MKLMKRALTLKRTSNYATHRPRGVIPGCTPAKDIFIERTQAEVRAYLMVQAEDYCWQLQNNTHTNNGINVTYQPALATLKDGVA